MNESTRYGMTTLLKRSFAVLVLFAVLSHPTAMLGQALTFTTFAGTHGGWGVDDGIGTGARFNQPIGVATDSRGNVYVADTQNNTIRKVTPAGAVTTLAGLAESSGSADGPGSVARFLSPKGVATDSGGNVYVADYNNHAIRKVTPAGAVTTLAGLGSFGSADGTGSVARFNGPSGVATDSSGNVYVADQNNHTIRKITPAGAVTTLAGLAGSTGSDDGAGSAARFNGPSGVATDSSGNVYVADQNNHSIRKITPAGAVTTLGALGRTGSADGVATDSSGNVYVAGRNDDTIRKITPAGAVTTLAGRAGSTGSDDGAGSAARFNGPSGVATDSSGNVYVADQNNSTIRKVTPAGAVTTLAGLAFASGSADGTGSAALFNQPNGMATDTGGNVYVGDTFNNTIRKITPAGAVTTLAGDPTLPGENFGSGDGTGRAASFNQPVGVATDSSGNVYVADASNSTIRKITPAGAVTTLAGLAESYGSADGTGKAARFNVPTGVATDSSGNIYVADYGNSTIRKVTPAGAVTTLAGLAGSSGSADGTGSAARFFGPRGVATDSSGNIYVADSQNGTIRKITSAGEVTTLAGNPVRFNGPYGVATDSTGNVYAADYGTIRKITPAGEVTTLGGDPGIFGNRDGTGSAARFNGAFGVAPDSSGNVYIADTFNHTIRVGRIGHLADIPTIDVTTGPVFVTRQLDTSPQTAISWQWSVIRRPVDSVADLSSATVRNPTFTPDVPGLFTFRLVATGTAAASITTVNFLGEAVPRRRAARH